MLRVTLAGLRAHSRRMFATALAVIFGVGFVAGTLIFSDTARAGYYDTFARTARSVDVAVLPPDQGGPLSAAQVAAVRDLSTVEAVDARLARSLALVGRNGRPLTNFGEVGYGISVDGDPRLRGFDVTGRTPTAAGEAMVDQETVAHQRFAVGSSITVLDHLKRLGA